MLFSTDAVVSCPPLQSPDNGQLMVAKFTFKSRAFFVCDNGYELSGSQVVSCLSTGQWSAEPPTCNCEYYVFCLSCLLPNLHVMIKEMHTAIIIVRFIITI